MISINGMNDADYLLGGGCGGHAQDPSSGPADYQTDSVAQGEPPGQWAFRGEQALPLTGKITAEGTSGDAYRALVNELRDPTQPKVWVKIKGHPDGGAWKHPRLGRAPQSFKTPDQLVAAFVKKNPGATVEEIDKVRVKAEARQYQAKNAWDVVYSPDKSWSVLHAAWQLAGRYEDAEKLWQCVEAGRDAALTVLFEELSLVRNGPAGPQVEGRSTTHFSRAKGLVMATWRHHVSRDRDPQIHSHTTVINRVLTESGAWQALYSPAFTKSKHMMDAVADRVAEGLATRELGLQFAANSEGHRQIVGVSQTIRDQFSSRTRALTEEAQQEVDRFTARNGRAPNTRERWLILQRATLGTRKAKPKTAPAREEDLARWEEEARREAHESLHDVTEQVDAARVDVVEVPVWDRQLVIKQALVDLGDRKATFNKSQLMFAIDKRLPDMLAVAPDDVPWLLNDLTEEAIRSSEVISTEAKPAVPVPQSLRDPKTGRSVFEAPEGRRFTTRKHLAREQSMVARLDHTGAPKVSTMQADVLLANAGLFDEQRGAVRRILSSGHRLEVVDAAAGTGKSRTMKALSDATEAEWGVGVVGFALAENAAKVLRGEGVTRAFNVDRFLRFKEREARGAVSDVDRATFAVAPGSYVVVDEASMMDTPKLTALLSALDEVGVGKVVLVGDVEQVDAVDAGGGFSMLVAEVERRDKEAAKAQKALPPAQANESVAVWTGEGQPEREAVEVTPRLNRLTQVRRFTHEWERKASLELHDGKVEALTQYDARGRIHGSTDPEQVREIAVKGFLTDWLSGRDSMVVTGTVERAAEVASHVRQRLVEAGHVTAEGVVLRDKNIAGVGDLIQSRQNDREVEALNRDRWQVIGSTDRGDLEVRAVLGRDENGEPRYGDTMTMPASYAKNWVELAYTGTVHAVEGMTIKPGSSWVVVDRQMPKSHAYVAGGRATDANHFVVELEPVAPQRHNEPDEAYEARAHRETPLGRLAEVFSKDDHVQAARVEIAAEQARATNLGHLVPQWEWTIRETRAITHRAILQETLGADADRVLSDPASNKVFNKLRTAELTGHDPREVLQAVRATRDLKGAKYPAQLLYAQIDDELATGPLVKPTPATCESLVPKTSLGDPENEQLAFGRATGRSIDDRIAELGRLQAEDPEEWAIRALGPVPEDEVARGGWIGRIAPTAGFREAYGWDDPKEALPRNPLHAEPEKAWWWDFSARLIGMPDSERDLQGRSDAELANRIQDHERAQAWGPPNRDAELREAHLALEEARYQVVRARAANREDIAELEADQVEMQALVGKYETVATARAAWYEATRTERERAEEARQEKDRRAEVEQARAGTLPVVDDPEADVEPEMDEADVHAAVFERWQQHHVPGLTTMFGSPRWVELDDDHPEKQAAVTAAANRAWNFGAWLEQDADKVTERLEKHGLDDLPDDYVTSRALDRIREARWEQTEDWDYIGPMTQDEAERHAPTVDEVMQDEPATTGELLASVFAWAQPHLEGEAPDYGSAAWAQADEPEKMKAEARAALSWWRAGDDLDERVARADKADEVASSHAIADELQQQDREWVAHHKTQEQVEAHRERIAERATEKAELESARNQPEETVEAQVEDVEEPAESTVNESGASEAYAPNLGSEPAEAKVEPQPSPEPEVEVEVEWPEVKAPPEPEAIKNPEPESPQVTEPEEKSTPVERPEPSNAHQEPEQAEEDLAPVVDEPPAIDRSSYQWALDAHEQQRAEVEPEPVKDDPEPDTEPAVDPKAERDAQLQADLEKAREATAKLAEMQQPEPERDAPAPVQPEPERELADD